MRGKVSIKPAVLQVHHRSGVEGCGSHHPDQANPSGFALRLSGPNGDTRLDQIWMADGVEQAAVALPGDCISLILDNYNVNGNLITPALTFDLAL